MMIGELAALGAALSWTVSAVLYKEALLKAKPVSANIVRLGFTSLILLLALVVIGKFGVLVDLSANAILLAAVSGIIGLGFGDTLYMTSLKSIGVARAVPITCTYPLFSFLWVAFLKGEHVNLPIVAGAFLIVSGIWLLSREEKESKFALDRKMLIKGVASALAAAVLWSISITMIDVAVTLPETKTLESALAINTLRITAIAVFLLALSPIIDKDHAFLKMNKKTMAALLLGGIVALGLGWFFLAFSFINTSESIAVPISSTTPLFSTLLAIIFLHERVTTKNVIGSTIIIVGIFLLFIT